MAVVVRFLGRVIPKILRVTITNHPGMTWVNDEHNATIFFGFKIIDGFVTVECHMEEFDEGKHYIDLYLRAIDWTMVALDMVSMSTGKHHRLLLDRWVKPNGEIKNIYDYFPVSPPLNSALAHLSDAQNLMKIIYEEPALMKALRDLIAGTMENHASAVNFGRIIDALRKLVAPDLQPKPGWAELRKVVRVEQSYLDPISETSKDFRHGSFYRVQGDKIIDITTRTWTVMNRYLEYRKRGNQPLPDSEFPVLS